MIYAGIGSRETPPEALSLAGWLGYSLGKDNWILRSGGARGADRAFESGCDEVGGRKEIFTPDDVEPWAMETVEKYHPAPDRLGDYAFKLMARNAMILFGRDGNATVDYIICWTPGGAIKGGTGQALRIAEDYNSRQMRDHITIYNMANIWDQRVLEDYWVMT